MTYYCLLPTHSTATAKISLKYPQAGTYFETLSTNLYNPTRTPAESSNHVGIAGNLHDSMMLDDFQIQNKKHFKLKIIMSVLNRPNVNGIWASIYRKAYVYSNSDFHNIQ